MGPSGTYFAGSQSAFGDKEICIPAERDCVLTRAGVGAETDDLPVKREAEADTGSRVDKGESQDGKREIRCLS
jgi:hypothetical protein